MNPKKRLRIPSIGGILRGNTTKRNIEVQPVITEAGSTDNTPLIDEDTQSSEGQSHEVNITLQESLRGWFTKSKIKIIDISRRVGTYLFPLIQTSFRNIIHFILTRVIILTITYTIIKVCLFFLSLFLNLNSLIILENLSTVDLLNTFLNLWLTIGICGILVAFLIYIISQKNA